MDKKNIYPILLIPKAIEDLQKSNVTVEKVFGISNPVKPQYKPIISFIRYLIGTYLFIAPFLIIFIMIISLVFGNDTLKRIYLLGLLMQFITFCLPPIVAIILVYRDIVGNSLFVGHKEKIIEWESQKKRFHEFKSKFDNDKSKYEKEFKKNELFKILKQATPSIQHFLPTKSGISEQFFLKHLTKHFGSSISKNTGIMLENIPYRCDFYYYDKEYNLHIDIEIDEPYTYDKKEAIHYEDNEHDNYRNMIFLSHSWVVLRFAEEQVVCQPEECCKFIAKVINEICFDELLGNDISVKQIKQWNMKEALILAREHFRNTYLHKILNNLVENDTY